MFQRILVALDGSELAEQVLPEVMALAQRFGSTIVLARATPSIAQIAAAAAGSGLEAGPLMDPTPMIEAEQQAAEEYLETVAERLRSAGLRVSGQTPAGAPGAAILDCATKMDAELIAMTTHGHTGLIHLVFGSVAEDVLRRAPCPVLLVRVRE